MKYILTLIVLFLSTSVFSQNINATTEAGEKVVLMSNGKWKYAKEKSASAGNMLKSTSGKYSLKFDPSQWKPTEEKLNDDAEFSLMDDDGKLFAMAMMEDIPLSYEEVKNHILASYGGDAKVLEEAKLTLNGKEVHSLKMEFAYEGINYTMLIYVYSREDWYARVISWTFKNLYSKKEKQIKDLLNSLTVLKP